jgi:hypothetical protein
VAGAAGDEAGWRRRGRASGGGCAGKRRKVEDDGAEEGGEDKVGRVIGRCWAFSDAR